MQIFENALLKKKPSNTTITGRQMSKENSSFVEKKSSRMKVGRWDAVMGHSEAPNALK